MEENWIFTFGSSHPHPNKFVKIFGSWESARDEMVRRYGNKWAFQYPEHMEKEIKRFFITELKE